MTEPRESLIGDAERAPTLRAGEGPLPRGGDVVQSPPGGTNCPPWLWAYLELQTQLNCLSSVALEVPALRPAVDALRKAMGE